MAGSSDSHSSGSFTVRSSVLRFTELTCAVNVCAPSDPVARPKPVMLFMAEVTRAKDQVTRLQNLSFNCFCVTFLAMEENILTNSSASR